MYRQLVRRVQMRQSQSHDTLMHLSVPDVSPERDSDESFFVLIPHQPAFDLMRLNSPLRHPTRKIQRQLLCARIISTSNRIARTIFLPRYRGVPYYLAMQHK